MKRLFLALYLFDSVVDAFFCIRRFSAANVVPSLRNDFADVAKICYLYKNLVTNGT